MVTLHLFISYVTSLKSYHTMQNSPDSHEAAFVIAFCCFQGTESRGGSISLFTASYVVFIFLRTMALDKTEQMSEPYHLWNSEFLSTKLLL